MSSSFIEPGEDDSSSSSAVFVGLLSKDKEGWLYSIIKSEYRVDEDLLSEIQHRNLDLIRQELSSSTSFDFVRFKVWFIYYSKWAKVLCDNEVLELERSSFPWDRFLVNQKYLNWFLEQNVPANILRLQTDKRLNMAWMELPLAMRAECYESESFNNIVGFAEQLEHLPPDISVPEGHWSKLGMGIRYFSSYCRMLRGYVGNIESGDLPGLADPVEYRFNFLGILNNETLPILPLLYQGADFDFVMQEVGSYLNQNPEEAPTSKNACWQYLVDLASSSGPEAAIIFLQALIPISIKPILKCLDDKQSKMIVDKALDMLFQPQVFQSVLASLEQNALNQVPIKPFHRLFLKQLGKRLINPTIPFKKAVRIFSLWFRYYDSNTRAYSNTENIPALPDSKTLYRIMNSCIQSTGSLEPLLTLPGLDQLHEFERTTWYASLIRAAGSVVNQSERNIVPQKTFGIQSDGTILCLFDNPIMEYFRPLLTRELIMIITKNVLGGSKDDLAIFSLALVFNNEGAITALQHMMRDHSNLQDMAYLQAVYTLSLSSPDLPIKHIEEFIHSGHFQSLPIALLEHLDVGESELFNYACNFHFDRLKSESSYTKSDFRMKYPQFAPKMSFAQGLQSEKQYVPDYILLKVLELLDKPELDGLGTEVRFGLELADLALLFTLPDNELSERFKLAATKAAQIFFDTLRKEARNGSSWESTGVTAAWLQNASIVISILKNSWSGIKQLLLLFRYAPVASIGTNLDPFTEIPGSSWSAVPRELHWQLARIFTEPKGRELRSQMTHDLLEFLKPRKEDPDRRPKEPDEKWRYAYIRAIADLGADPKGEKHFHHQVLDKCTLHDPSVMVREAAKRASEKLKTRTGWKSGSSKRTLLNAWWWIRQAHLLSLGSVIDAEAALKLRDTEARK